MKHTKSRSFFLYYGCRSLNSSTGPFVRPFCMVSVLPFQKTQVFSLVTMNSRCLRELKLDDHKHGHGQLYIFTTIENCVDLVSLLQLLRMTIFIPIV